MNLRKSIVVMVALFLFSVPLFKSSAQVSSSESTMSSAELQAMISSLLLQIADLRAQLNAQQVTGATASSPTFVNFSNAPSCKKLLVNLRVGNRGDNVAILQDFLKQQGYVISSGEDSDNRFGESTAGAVSSFQQKYASEILTPANLTRPNSFVGQRTRDKINSLLCSGVVPPVPVVSTTTPIVAPVSDPVISELGVTSSSINSGESTVLFWNTLNVTKLTMDYQGSIHFLTVPGGKMSVSPTRTTTFVVTASNSQGKMAAKSVTVNVTPAVATTTTVATPVPACPKITSPANGASYTVGQDITFSWGAVTGRNTYVVDLTTDPGFSWWWNNGAGTGGGSSALSANFSSIKNDNYATYYAKGGGPVVPATGTTYYWRVYAYDSATNQGCHSEVRSFKFVPVTQTSLAPTISSISPSSVTTGSTVTLTGANFNQNTYVNFDATSSVLPTVLSSNKLTFIPPVYLNVGSHKVQLSEKGSAFPLSGSVTLNIIEVAKVAPVIYSITPTSAKEGDAVTLTGANFNQNTFVAFDAVSSITPTFINSNTLTFVVPTGLSVGSHKLQVNEKGAAFPLSSSVVFNVISSVLAPAPVPAPTVSVTASASSVVSGSPVTLSWTSTNATKLTMDYGGSILTLPLSGTKVVKPTVTTRYVINAQNSVGEMAAGWVVVTVTQPTPASVPAPTVNVTASASSVTAGSPVTLSWTSTNTTQLTMDYGGSIITLPTSGTKVVNPAITTTYTIKGQNSAGVYGAGGVTVNVTQPVVVAPVPACPTVTNPANGASYTVGQDITFSWGAATGRNTYVLDLTTDPNFAWQWNNGSGPAGGSSSLSANLSSIRNSYYAGGRLAPAGVLEAGKTYYWRVYAYDSATMQGCHSEVRSLRIVGPAVSSTVGAPGLYSPANGATILAGSNPTFSWSTGNYSTYIMDLTTDPNFGWQWNSGSGAIGGSSATSVTFSGIKNTTYSNGNPVPASLEAGKTYYWRVYGYNPASPSTGAHSAIYMFKVANMVATESNQNTNQLANIYSSLQMIMDALKGLTR